MNKQKISKDESKREFVKLAKNIIAAIISNPTNSLEQKNIETLWSHLRFIEEDKDYLVYFDLYTGLSDYNVNPDLISVEELVNLFNKVIYLENSKKNG